MAPAFVASRRVVNNYSQGEGTVLSLHRKDLLVSKLVCSRLRMFYSSGFQHGALDPSEAVKTVMGRERGP